jgi:hypothetical protein
MGRPSPAAVAAPAALLQQAPRSRFQSDPVAFLRSLQPGSVCAVTGAPRTGKTTTVQRACRAGLFRRRVVFEPYGFRDRLNLQRGEKVSPWTGEIGTAVELLAHPELLDRDPVALVVSSRNLSRKVLGNAFSVTADLVWHTGGVDLICEEAGLYSREATELIMRFASGGGHCNSRVIFIVQSLGRLTKDGRRHLSHVLAFAAGEVSDIEDYRKRCGPEFAAELQRLRAADPETGRPADPPIAWQLGQVLTQ